MIQMPGLAWSGPESHIYYQWYLTVSPPHLPAITSIEEMLTTRCISDHEKFGGCEIRLEYFRLWAEQNHCAIHEFFIREIANQILEFLGSIISFACGIQARLAGGQNILLARWIYYLLFTMFAWRQRYHLSWLSLTSWHSVINNLLPSWPPADSFFPTWLFSNQWSCQCRILDSR